MEDTIRTIGRRKASVVRLFLKKGSGIIRINNREVKNYFPTSILQYKVNQPITVAGVAGAYDIDARIEGGGTTGQAEALRLAIARALVKVNPELKPKLKSEHFLTRDPRKVERKKFGKKKARKGFQFTKR
ncbi:MAG: 30S ribosomal protein S9 [Bacteroidetes bacterium]|nr:30S ribosomal protein S9 [Bacteroidota bacterium]